MKDIRPESLEAVTHTHTHKTFYRKTIVSNTYYSEAILSFTPISNNKCKLEIEML